MIQRDEQRVIDALRAYTGGITVTDQDIATAESRLRGSLEPPSPRRRLIILAAAVAAVLVVGFLVSRAIDSDPDSAPPIDRHSSPAATLKAALQADAYDLSSADFSAGAQPTASDMAGFWLLREPFIGPLLVDGGGHWWMGLPTDRFGGTSTLTGDTWTRRFAANMCDQPDGFSLPWQAAIASDSSLHLTFTGSENVCTPADDREVWDRVTPGSPVADYLLAVTQEADWQAAPVSFLWQGLYVAPATGHLLEARSDGSYRYYDTLTDASLVAADRGEIGVDSAGTSGSCAGGSFTGTVEVAQIPGVDEYVGSYDAVRFTSTMDNCGTGFAKEDVWVTISR